MKIPSFLPNKSSHRVPPAPLRTSPQWHPKASEQLLALKAPSWQGKSWAVGNGINSWTQRRERKQQELGACYSPHAYINMHIYIIYIHNCIYIYIILYLYLFLSIYRDVNRQGDQSISPTYTLGVKKLGSKPPKLVSHTGLRSEKLGIQKNNVPSVLMAIFSGQPHFPDTHCWIHTS